MKKSVIVMAFLACALGFGAAAAKADGASIVGKWKFDLGGNFMASVEYRADGTLVQITGGMTMTGTYVLTGDKLTTVVNGQATTFTIVSRTDSTMTIRRDRDGKTVTYTKEQARR
jgi:uncharacterized protein (TIGR03066 family)